jgi:hypothetical protein
MDLGGKVIVFGRWGDMNVQDSGRIDVISYVGTSDSVYTDQFSIASRGVIFSFLSISSFTLYSDLVGAHSNVAGYPDLSWDTLRTVAHEIGYPNVTGIPCPSFVTLNSSPDIEVLYTYESRWSDFRTNNKTVAWKGSDDYVYFDLPLSFMERSSAITALQMAINDLGTSNLFIEMDYYDIDFATTDTATFLPDPVTLNISSPAGPGLLSWLLIENAPWLEVDKTSGTNPDQITFSLRDSAYSGGVWSTPVEILDIGAVNSPIYVHVSLTVEGEGCCTVPGDINQSGIYDIGDAVYVIAHIFKGGPPPSCDEAADANNDCQYNITDAVHIVNHVFKGGSPPSCSTCYP